MTHLYASSTADNTALEMQTYQFEGNTKYHQGILHYIQTSNSKEFPLYFMDTCSMAIKRGGSFKSLSDSLIEIVMPSNSSNDILNRSTNLSDSEW